MFVGNIFIVKCKDLVLIFNIEELDLKVFVCNFSGRDGMVFVIDQVVSLLELLRFIDRFCIK